MQGSGPMQTNVLGEANENGALAEYVFSSEYGLHKYACKILGFHDGKAPFLHGWEYPQ